MNNSGKYHREVHSGRTKLQTIVRRFIPAEQSCEQSSATLFPWNKVADNSSEACSNGKSPMQPSGSLFQRKKFPATVRKSVPTEKGQIELSGSLFQQKKGKTYRFHTYSNGTSFKTVFNS
jgi:hypothetical protein